MKLREEEKDYIVYRFLASMLNKVKGEKIPKGIVTREQQYLDAMLKTLQEKTKK